MSLNHHLTHTETQLTYLRKEEEELTTKLTNVQQKIASHELAIQILKENEHSNTQQNS